MSSKSNSKLLGKKSTNIYDVMDDYIKYKYLESLTPEEKKWRSVAHTCYCDIDG